MNEMVFKDLFQNSIFLEHFNFFILTYCELLIWDFGDII